MGLFIYAQILLNLAWYTLVHKAIKLGIVVSIMISALDIFALIATLMPNSKFSYIGY